MLPLPPPLLPALAPQRACLLPQRSVRGVEKTPMSVIHEYASKMMMQVGGARGAGGLRGAHKAPRVCTALNLHV